MGIHADLIHSHTGYDVISYFSLAFFDVRKNDHKCCLREFGANFSGAAFHLTHQLVGFFVIFLDLLFIPTVVSVSSAPKMTSTVL